MRSRFLILAATLLAALAVGTWAPQATRADEQTVTVTWGPYTVPGGTEEAPGSTNNLPAFSVAMPCTDCYITSITPNLVYADGSTANHDTMAMLHHMVAFAKPTLDPTCSGMPWDFLGRRIFASGNERSPVVLPSGYGLYNPANASWNLVIDIMNMMEDPQDLYLQFTFTYRHSTDNVKPATPVWLDVNNCSSSEFTAPAGYSDTHWDWTSTLTGDVIAIGGHVHDYGIGVSAERVNDSTSICSSVASYAMDSPLAPPPVPDGDASHPGSVNLLDPGNMNYMGSIEDMTGCSPYLRISAGETIRLHARYNPPADAPGVMGIMMAWVYETTDPPPDMDSDTVRDELDNCPMWANGTQALPNWAVPPADSDCDGYPDSVQAGSSFAFREGESVIGTVAAQHCSTTAAGFDEPLPDAWPPDFNDNQLVNVGDLLSFNSSFGQNVAGPPVNFAGTLTPVARWDLNGSGLVNVSDVLQLNAFIFKRCDALP